MKFEENTILYHGSYIVVDKPDLSQCRKGKDFGQGFYLTTSKAQAIKFVKTSIKKAISDKIISADTATGYISMYKSKTIDGLKVFEFTNADSEWLHCVIAHRKLGSVAGEIEKYKDFDIISGKIANDTTNTVITAYMDGLYGEVGSDSADRIAIGFLEPDNLKDQICYRTQKAIETLKYLGCESVII